MTIVVGVATPDGLVLAADSRTTYTDGTRHRIVSDNAQKLFPVGRMGVATAGNAFIGQDTIAGKMDRFVAQLEDKAYRDLDRFLESLGKFFDKAFKESLASSNETWDPETQGYPIVFLVAGYDDDGVGYVKEVLIPGPKIGEISLSTLEMGTMWRGQTDVIGRLINGIDWGELAISGEALPEELTERLRSLSYNVLSPITVQDAVDYVTFLIRTTIDMQRFGDGTLAHPALIPGCGGPIHSMVVERSSIRWASRSTRQHWESATPGT